MSSFVNSLETEVHELNPDFNSLNKLNELLAKSNSEGMVDWEDLLDILLQFSKELLSPIFEEPDISCSVPREVPGVQNLFQK